MAASQAPQTRDPPGVRRAFTLPTKFAEASARPASRDKEPSTQAIETLFAHPSARIVHFTTASSARPSPARRDPTNKGTVQDGEEPGTLPWKTHSERTIAVGPFRIYRVPGSVAFLNAGSFLRPVLAKSQCWCVDGESKFVIKKVHHEFYRIELPFFSDEDKVATKNFKTALEQVLRYEKTPCPFERGFEVQMPESPQITYVPWKPKHRPVSPLRRQSFGISPDRQSRPTQTVPFSNRSSSQRSLSVASSSSAEQSLDVFDSSPARRESPTPSRIGSKISSIKPTIGRFETLDKDHGRDKLLVRGRPGSSNSRHVDRQGKQKAYNMADAVPTIQTDLNSASELNRSGRGFSSNTRVFTAPLTTLVSEKLTIGDEVSDVLPENAQISPPEESPETSTLEAPLPASDLHSIVSHDDHAILLSSSSSTPPLLDHYPADIVETTTQLETSRTAAGYNPEPPSTIAKDAQHQRGGVDLESTFQSQVPEVDSKGTDQPSEQASSKLIKNLCTSTDCRQSDSQPDITNETEAEPRDTISPSAFGIPDEEQEEEAPNTPIWHSASDVPVRTSSASIKSSTSASTSQTFVTARTSSSSVPRLTRVSSNSSTSTKLSKLPKPLSPGRAELRRTLSVRGQERARSRSRSPIPLSKIELSPPQDTYETVGAAIGEKMAGVLLGPPLQLASLMLRIASRFTDGVRIRADGEGQGWGRRSEKGRRLPGTWENFSEDEGDVVSEWEDDYGISIYGLERQKSGNMKG